MYSVVVCRRALRVGSGPDRYHARLLPRQGGGPHHGGGPRGNQAPAPRVRGHRQAEGGPSRLYRAPTLSRLIRGVEFGLVEALKCERVKRDKLLLLKDKFIGNLHFIFVLILFISNSCYFIFICLFFC